MVENNKKRISKFSIIIIMFFVLFLAIYLTSIGDLSGYENYKKMNLTKDAITKFEDDIKSGKDVSVNKYSNINLKDYSNKAGEIGRETGEFLEGIFNSAITETVKVFAFFFGTSK